MGGHPSCTKEGWVTPAMKEEDPVQAWVWKSALLGESTHLIRVLKGMESVETSKDSEMGASLLISRVLQCWNPTGRNKASPHQMHMVIMKKAYWEGCLSCC